MPQKLTSIDHDRYVVGLTYVYPVISRRAGGLSIGINFNPNNACNWRCIYCQVPDLKKGAAPNIEFKTLEHELNNFLADVLEGDFYQRFNVPDAQRVIKDIAISGNGEPTSVKEFAKAITVIGECATKWSVLPQANFVLITNGSFIHRQDVQHGLKRLKDYQGEIWFKVDSATSEGISLINNSSMSPQAQFSKLITATHLCQTKLQTCFVNYQHQGLLDSEKQAYLTLIQRLKPLNLINEIMLYTIERQSFQKEAVDLEKMPFETLESLANEIRELGFHVSVSG
ncbi:MAG: radical SAM protein [Methylococcales bacterium]|nr:radical SAM protein [Methylococcales bacterium]